MNGEREARFWSDRKKAFREFDHDEMTYATQALMGIYDALEDIRAILKDIDEDVTKPKMPPAQPEITLESAIDYLHSIGWMQEHDRVLTESAQPEQKNEELLPDGTLHLFTDADLSKVGRVLVSQNGTHYGALYYADGEPKKGGAEFINWLLDEVWDDEMWELNYRAFPELLCRRLAKAGWLKEEGGRYVRLD